MNVRWSETARGELAKLWLRSDSVQRRLVAAAAHRVDQRLQANAENEGESRSDDRRIVFEPPLGILFRVDKHTATVHVLTVWKFR